MSEWLLASLWHQGLLLSLAVLLMGVLRRAVLKHLGAGSAYAAWLLVPAMLVTPWLPRPAREPLLQVLQAAGQGAATTGTVFPAPPADQARLWLALWLAGAALVAAAQTARQLRLTRLGDRLPAGSSPALIGLLRPRVALPEDFEQRFSPQERELILAHERVHRDRLDNFWNLLACALTALHWWNPLTWWAIRRMRADQELACDAAVLAARPAALADYTRALLAAHDLTPHGAPLASRWTSSHPLVERIAMLKRSTALSRRRAAALCLTLLGIVGGAYAAQTGTPAADPAQSVEIRLDVAVGDYKSSPRLITALGVPAAIEWGPTRDNTWRLDFTVTRDADGQLQVLTQSRHQGKTLGRHTNHIASGQPFGHRLDAEDGTPPLQMTRVVTLLPTADKPSR